jgi:hypothetical protein
MLSPRFLLSCGLIFLPVSCRAQEKPKKPVVPETCPVTKPAMQPFVPPPPYPAKPDPSSFWFGTDRLWTALPETGAWARLPHYSPSDPTLRQTFRQKLFFWSQGYDPHTKPQPNLNVTGKRLDATATPLQSDEHANGGWTKDDQFIVTGINFPTTGCWEVRATYGGDQLTFVIWVAP